MLEVLIALVVLMGLLLFLQPFIKNVTLMEEHVKKSAYLEVQIGKIQMELETRWLTFDRIENNRLIYRDEEKTQVIFEQYQQMIRKITSKNGHQPIMTNIKSSSFIENDGVIEWEVVTLEGEKYTYFLFPAK